MAIYSDQVQTLTNQLVSQVAALETAVNAPTMDIPTVTSAANAVQTTANDLNTAITTADVPADGTMILHVTTDLIGQVGDLQTAITAVDNALIISTTDLIVVTTNNLNWCVTKMSEVQVAYEETPPLWPPLNVPSS